MNRQRTPTEIETKVLLRSKRRCTLCFHLDGDLDEKQGQIAHLDKNPSNSAEDNLAFMCLKHHSLFDSKTSQHKNYTIQELKAARSDLYRAIDQGEHVRASIANVHTGTTVFDAQRFHDQLIGLADTEVLKHIWNGPRWRILIRPSVFKEARFKDLTKCAMFIKQNIVYRHTEFDFPHASLEPIQEDLLGQWIAGETKQENFSERWTLFRSGLFIEHRTLQRNSQLGDAVHFRHLLEMTTNMLEFAKRMARESVLFPEAEIQIELHKVAGYDLLVPEVTGEYWGRSDSIRAQRSVSTEELKSNHGELALDITGEIMAEFGFEDPSKFLLSVAQAGKP